MSNHAVRRNMSVFVINRRGFPLMPCSPAKARILLKQNKASVVKRTPFTIKLNIATGENRQPVTLGIDTGYENVGVCASTSKRILYVAEVKLRTDITKLLAQRREARRTRRHRKTRYRAARFDNRNKPKGWLAPSIQHKIDSHIRIIEKVTNILPVIKIVIETATFDIQKIKNPDISGTGYQQGDQLGFWNVREYVLWRDGHRCQHCHGKSKDMILNVHHIESRQIGGDAPNNLVTLCETCHKAHHQGKIKLNLKRGQSFRLESAMSTVRWKIVNQVRELFPRIEVRNTYGYLTKSKRIGCGLEKSHRTDAFCIAGNLDAKDCGNWFYQVQKRRHNRQMNKLTIRKGGIRPLNQNGYITHGFRLFDKVKFNGETGFVFGKRTSGYFDVRNLDGTRISASVSYKKLTLLEKRRSFLTDVIKQNTLLTVLKDRVSA